MQKNFVFLELGGNKGDRLSLIKQAKKLLAQNSCKIIAQSSVYETPPWGFSATQNFYNQVIKIETAYSAIELIYELQKIEKILGRVRGPERYESRSMDIDILFFNCDIINKNDLTIPHPRLHLRKFVLVPMNEIAPGFIHPKLKLSIKQLLSDCTDPSVCNKIE